jgi:hypothetical protein
LLFLLVAPPQSVAVAARQRSQVALAFETVVPLAAPPLLAPLLPLSLLGLRLLAPSRTAMPLTA